MSKVRIVVDSTADVPHAIAEELDIKVVPLNVHFGDQVYLDWVELKPDQFYHLLETSKDHPRTSQPSPGDFAKAYEELIKDGADVVSIHISANLSGTFQSATLGQSMLGKGRVEVIDTKGASMVVGIIGIEAARAAKAGRSFEEVVARARDLVGKVKVVFAVDTLEYLARNGRIGRAQAFLGSLVSIKPLLTFDEDGFVAPLEKVRGERKVLPRMVELLGENIDPGKNTRCCIVHAKCPEKAEELKKLILASHKVEEFIVTDLGPVIGTHTGPGTVGLIYYQS